MEILEKKGRKVQLKCLDQKSMNDTCLIHKRIISLSLKKCKELFALIFRKKVIGDQTRFQWRLASSGLIGSNISRFLKLVSTWVTMNFVALVNGVTR